jgi:hypothetical protein
MINHNKKIESIASFEHHIPSSYRSAYKRAAAMPTAKIPAAMAP